MPYSNIGYPQSAINISMINQTNFPSTVYPTTLLKRVEAVFGEPKIETQQERAPQPPTKTANLSSETQDAGYHRGSQLNLWA